MDLDNYLNAILLGMVEGITEFLPISSTGHLIIAGNLLGFTGPRADTFEIFIQLGAILAVLWNYREQLIEITINYNKSQHNINFLFNLLVAFLPAAILGFVLHRYIKNYLFSPITVASALFLGGIAIIVIESRNYNYHIEKIEELTWQDALKVGCAQCLALFPGVSRAGATIMGGIIFGLSRRAATEFSFFLAIPTMFVATFYDLYKSRSLLSLADIPIFTLGFIVSFLSALVVIRAFLVFIGNNNFTNFAWYRIIFGGIILLYAWYFPGTFVN